ncbi:MAG TPA: hypothetical protein VJA46_03925 [Acidimicrobiia bacterium]|nr:hypothetical protein [Acidimicrobiia bacterium]
MAEIALGGIHVAVGAKRARQAAKVCPHTETLTTTTGGLERIVCESCGHLSFQYPEVMSGPVHRRWFARPADRVEEPRPTDEPDDDWLVRYTPVIHTPHVHEEAAAAAARAFAAQERFHIRSRYELHPETSAAVA